ncbi:hypothetical protein [Enterococcus faecalis]
MKLSSAEDKLSRCREDLIQIVTVFSCRLQGKRAKKVRLRPTEEQ